MEAFVSKQKLIILLAFSYLSISDVTSDLSFGDQNPCENDAACEVLEGSYCDNLSESSSGLCTCKPGTVDIGESKCLSLIGQPCSESQQCVGQSTNTSFCLIGSSPRLCDCRPGLVHNTNLTGCLPIKDFLGEPCEENIQCQLGAPGNLSFCSNRVCECNADSVPVKVNATTYLPATCMCAAIAVGDQCSNDLQCTTNLGSSRCTGEVCVCSENYVNATTRCLPARELYESCLESVQCAVQNSECTGSGSKLCTCKTGYVNIPGTNTCFVKALIGERCEENVQCPPTSFCNADKKCECSEGYIPSSNKATCLKLATLLGDPCSEISQCQKLTKSECINSKCQCDFASFIQLSTTLCAPIVREINVPCMDSRQCTAGLGQNSLCENGYCQCKSSYMYSQGKCLVPAKLGQPCITVEQCFAGVNNLTICATSNGDTQRRCHCKPGAIPFGDDRKCYDEDKKIGESCESNEECTVSIVGQVHCSLNTKKCTCKAGFEPTPTNSICKSVGTKFQYSFTLYLIIVLFGATTKHVYRIT